MTPDRRTVLRGGLLAWVAVAAPLGGCALIPPLPPRDEPTAEAAAAWLGVTADGRIVLHSPRQEMGQRVGEALRRIVAAELDVPPERIDLMLPETDRMAVVRSTVGSESIQAYAAPLAEAARRLRRQFASWPPVAAVAGPPAVAPAEIIDVVHGGKLFAADVPLPDLLFGAMLRPERLGARLQSAAADHLPDGVRLVQGDGYAGLVAPRPGLLARSLELVRTRWLGGSDWGQPDLEAQLDVDRRLDAGRLAHTVVDGRPPDGPWDVDLRIDLPLAAHAAIEPRAAIARWRPDGRGVEVWTGTQDAFFARRVVARAVGLDEAQVVVRSLRIGGGFGGRAVPLVEVEAALLARAAGPRPVLVQWTRADEFQHAYHRPPSSHRLRARLGADGRVAAWRHGFASGHVLFTSAAMPPWLQRMANAFAADGGVARGARPPYDLPAGATRVEFDTVRLPVATGPWRGLGAGPNAIVIEAAMDALAARAGQDPLAFRLRHLERQPRLAACLRQAAAMAGWGRTLPAGRALAIAAAPYKDASWAAVAAEVADQGGRIKVAGMWCAQDSGRVLDPDAVQAQAEGNMMWGIGAVLHERLVLADGRIAAASFADYALPTIADAPATMAVTLLPPPAGAGPGGAGETAFGPAAAAVFNAATRLRGAPARQLPLS